MKRKMELVRLEGGVKVDTQIPLISDNEKEG
jgi:hypothetical protein